MAVGRIVPNRVISKQEAEAILGPYRKQFRDAVEKAWAAWKGEEYAAVRYLHTPRARANIIHDRMVHFLKSYFDSHPTVRMLSDRGRAMANIDDVFVVRFKKMDANKRSRGVPTRQYVLFNAQIDFEGIPSSLTHLEVGYVLNSLQTELDGVYITCPNVHGIEWFIDLRESDAATGTGQVIPFPKAPAPDGGSDQSQSTESRGKRFKVKTDGKEKERSGDEGDTQS